ncbi:indolepyruvate ferredoxin oxidoreductase family protein [Hoeflea prorocentri]|uniref:Indolepyruvate ferredoxin oxidoreductase family protein n=1 Tax=Hoeflea prorocentri TaxID=1922333 RepID=A0A9X3ZFY8_9HYPH|nr:indolepyruvate ferredoxin oxidoreductase family protein [Hoeflea prorocentri]MCY6379199.1 indolepyruvate ferredoxin oxidoreductase family protein [Hoeflea prorocentri]MDA5397000.1 indolepyruvate ferredoxin oxidoreductase family protein [Hoeflea prorocentri]
MTLHDVSLDDKYDLSKNRIFVTGTQAVVRLLLMQKALDHRAGLNTAGFVSGYRGSPLGAFDQQLSLAKRQLEASDIVFQPGLNEELAATACWGTQQAELDGHGKYDGVFSVWYGKGPGVDRSGDVFRHANLAGTSPHGGVLALMGDDHTAESSTNAHQTEFVFVDTMIPILNPAGVQEIIDYGLYGFALSRFAGTWAALKCVKDNIESTGSVEAGLDRLNIVLPEFDMPPDGLNIRLGELDFLGQEVRLHEYKRDAVSAFIRANGLNKTIWSGGPKAKIGIISVGKSYLDVRQSLSDLGIDREAADRVGIRLMKVAAPWPLGLEDFRPFVDGLEMVIVVEEKRSLIESQLREALYGTAHQPVIVGKRDETGAWLFPVKGALDPNEISVAVGERVLKVAGHSEEIDARVKRIRQAQAMLSDMTDVAVRTPYFCSGCPHNSSTRVPEGSKAAAGIGCHFMAIWMDRETQGFTQMGGEGAQWVGQQPFSETPHIFQNLGDGTYNHSGILALRFAIAAGADVTYKILFNDAVAMTGGQQLDGGLTVDAIARQVRAEGVDRIAIVSDEPDKYPTGMDWPSGVTFNHRSELDAVQRELREVKGVSVLLYDQTCAAEKRRRRKRGTFPDPDRRVVINELVCEGCGDCGIQSNCVSVQPVETEFGRKRRIDQSSCNKDFSCLEGFCPSFVTVHGGKIRKSGATVDGGDPLNGVPDAIAAPVEDGWACVITGVGGTGVVTIGAILGMAAHIEAKGCGMIDMAGLAQKGGAVFSHVRIAAKPEDIAAIRVPAGKADLVLGCDLVVSGSRKVLASVRENETLFIANTAEIMPGDFARNADFSLPVERLKREIVKTAGEDRTVYFDGTAAANALFGNAIAANMFMLGLAAQRGGLPLSAASVERAIVLNGQAADMNIAAFRWGRRAAHDPQAVRDLVAAARTPDRTHMISKQPQEAIDRRVQFLTAYQSRRFAERYLKRIETVKEVDNRLTGAIGALSDAAAHNLFKLMAIKDEYEVARLFTDGSFVRQLNDQFESWDRLEFHLAPPFLAGTGDNGRPVKRRFGPWMLRIFALLSAARRFRGTPLDIFSFQEERRRERRLLAEYEDLLDEICRTVSKNNYDAAVALLSYPQRIRGYGLVKDQSVADLQNELENLKQAYFAGDTGLPQAAE